MPKFKDSTGQEWVFPRGYGELLRVREKLGVNLLNAADLSRVIQDPYEFVAVLHCLLEKQLGGKSIEQFVDLLDGDAMEAAGVAFEEAIVDFFRPGQRKAVATMLAKVRAANQQGIEMATSKLESPAMDAAIQTAIANASNAIDESLSKLNNTSGSAPA